MSGVVGATKFPSNLVQSAYCSRIGRIDVLMSFPKGMFPVSRLGRCLCGCVQLDIEFDGFGLDVCHCTNYQLQTGSPFAAFLAVPTDSMVASGPIKKFADHATVSGNTVERYFCGECGSPSYVEVVRAPNTAYAFSGLFTETGDLTPKVHGWTSQKHRWTHIEESIPQYAEDPGLFPE